MLLFHSVVKGLDYDNYMSILIHNLFNVYVLYLRLLLLNSIDFVSAFYDHLLDFHLHNYIDIQLSIIIILGLGNLRK